MRKTLPFYSDVHVDTYHYLAYPYGIIKANYNNEQYYNSLFKHCSSLIWYGANSPTQLAFDSYYFTWWEHFKKEEIDNSLIKSQSNSIVKYIKSCIDKNRYIYLCVDDYYIPNRFCYKREHFKHDLLIYGYDDSSKSFLIAGYNNKGHYSIDNLSFEDLVKANPEDFVLLSVNEKYALKYNKSDYLELINRYILSDEKTRGINSLYKLLDYVDEIKNDYTLYDVKPFIVLLKHKSVIHMLLNKAKDKSSYEDLILKYENQFDICNKIKFSMMKYRFTKDKTLLSDVKTMINESMDLDYHCLQKIQEV